VYYPIYGGQQVRDPSLYVDCCLMTLCRIIICNRSVSESFLYTLPHTSKIVSPLKDVEGLHSKFHYNLYHKFVPSMRYEDTDSILCH